MTERRVFEKKNLGLLVAKGLSGANGQRLHPWEPDRNARCAYQVVHKFVEKFNLGLRTLNWVKLRLNFKFEG
jgi:hypothetical protein